MKIRAKQRNFQFPYLYDGETQSTAKVYGVVATPHVAGATAASKDRLWRTAIDQALKVLRGERAEYLCNPEVLQTRPKR